MVLIGNYLQLPPVKGRFIFSKFTSGSKTNQFILLSWVGIEKSETKFLIKKGSISSLIKKNQLF